MGHLGVLANPGSGSGEAERAVKLLEAREPDLARADLEHVDRLIAARPRRIVVAGGDGTIGCAAAAAARLGVSLAVVPVGTANDFARALGLPADTEAAVELALTGTRTRRVELGECVDPDEPGLEPRPFVNAVSAGLSPIAARTAGDLKATLGKLAYSVAAVRVGVAARPVDCSVACDGEPLFSGPAWQGIVACTGAFGGGADIAADPGDGRLDAVVIEAGSRARLLAHAYGLRYGYVERQRGVHTASAASVEIEAPGPGFNVDGELVDADRLRCAIRPERVEVVVE